MAMHRPQQVVPLIPPKLVTFDPREWPSLQAWSDARFKWLLAHPGRTIAGLDAVDVIYELENVSGTEHCA
jgi:hypothetical protein